MLDTLLLSVIIKTQREREKERECNSIRTIQKKKEGGRSDVVAMTTKGLLATGKRAEGF